MTKVTLIIASMSKLPCCRLPDPAYMPTGAGSGRIKRPERKFRRLQLNDFGWIYEVIRPRYALICFATHVETRSPPNYCASQLLRCAVLTSSPYCFVLSRLLRAVHGWMMLEHDINLSIDGLMLKKFKPGGDCTAIH